MSLDIILYGSPEPVECYHCGVTSPKAPDLFSINITHNLGGMADAAGLYAVMWRPDEMTPPVKIAREAIPFLQAGLTKLRSNPDEYREMNPKNGHGSYENLEETALQYLKACWDYPDAEISASR